LSAQQLPAKSGGAATLCSLWATCTAADPRFTVENLPHSVWFRSERQTLVRLPESQAVCFGIRIYQAPLGAIAASPERARRLLNAIETMAPEMDTYKSFAVFREPLREYLLMQTAKAPDHKRHSKL